MLTDKAHVFAQTFGFTVHFDSAVLPISQFLWGSKCLSINLFIKN